MNKIRDEARAIFFDLDGTIADNELLHYRAWHLLGTEKGIDISYEEYVHNYIGKNTFTILREVWSQRLNSPLDEENIYARKSEIYEYLIKTEAKTIEGFLDFHDQLKHFKVPTILVSNATPKSRNITLNALGIQDIFHDIIGPENNLPLKPSPDMYLLAAQKLNVHPKYCVVFEDSKSGYSSAKNAEMYVIGINGRNDDPLAQADYTIDHYRQLTVQKNNSYIRLSERI